MAGLSVKQGVVREYLFGGQSSSMEKLLKAPHALVEHMIGALHETDKGEYLFPEGTSKSSETSSVLFLLSQHCHNGRSAPEPCIVLNKRSVRVRQGGDLCFPGGRISIRVDSYASRFLTLPFSPLTRWPYWQHWRNHRRVEARQLVLLLATALRESFEEIRLNPLTVRFLGPMPSQGLPMFYRVLYPMVVWVRQKFFLPNWEVERIVHIPIRNLLNRDNYACYRLHFQMRPGSGHSERLEEDFPCFRHVEENEKEVLWGVTFRIVMVFLEIVFRFRPPEISSLPVIHGVLDERYLDGSVRSGKLAPRRSR
jgi:8-oxo-dGTP pyrophosphatase MutT (NUDIX family)